MAASPHHSTPEQWTTIKVPSRIRDRVNQRAHRLGVSASMAIESLLDTIETQGESERIEREKAAAAEMEAFLATLPKRGSGGWKWNREELYDSDERIQKLMKK